MRKEKAEEGEVVTIKDIAQEAGVSQGTVSNVLNHKGNVRSSKVRKVLEVAERKGYAINEKAKALRIGRSRNLALVIPSLGNPAWQDFATGFSHEAENAGYETSLYLRGDSQEREAAIASKLRASMTEAIAMVPYSSTQHSPYLCAGFAPKKILSIARQAQSLPKYVGFDWDVVAQGIADELSSLQIGEVSLFKRALPNGEESPFSLAFKKEFLKRGGSIVIEISTNDTLRYQAALKVFDKPVGAMVAEDMELGHILHDVQTNLYPGIKTRIFTLGNTTPLPCKDLFVYELDWDALGAQACHVLLEDGKQRNSRKERGFAHLNPAPFHSDTDVLSVVSLDSPTLKTLESVKNIFEETSGIHIEFKTYKYHELYELLAHHSEDLRADVLRLDSKLLSFFGPKELTELDEIAPKSLLDGAGYNGDFNRYGRIGGKTYAIPGTPSVQILFYRKDLFENIELSRLYYEKYKQKLLPPKDFAEFNRIASFFTKRLNPASPVDYGTTVALASSELAGTEFLTRYFSHSQELLGEDGMLFPEMDVAVQAMKELAEVIAYAGAEPISWWNETAAFFAGGKAAMTILYSNHGPNLMKPSSSVIGRIGWAPVPGGHPIMGGSILGIPRNSTHKQAALRFIEWLSRDDIATASTLVGGFSSRKSTGACQAVLESFPWLDSSLCMFANAQSLTKAMGGQCIDEQILMDSIGKAVQAMAGHKLDCNQAVEFARYTFQVARSAT